MGRPRGAADPDVPQSPAFLDAEDAVWNQSYLAKALLQIKETDMVKLKFTEGSYKPYEYEKWVQALKRLTNGYHPEIGVYWDRITKSSEDVFLQYLRDVNVTRVS